MNPLISVIVPVYNVEPYLDECIKSIIGQTYKKIELILVDDGSTDTSPIICDSYAREEKNIKVFHKTNGGLSDARNYGLAQAIGDYIIFIDSDDFWSDNTQLEFLVRVAMDYKYCDFIGFNCTYYYPSGNRTVKWPMFSERILSTTNKNIIIPELVKSGVFPMSACLKMIKREFLISNDIYFKYGIVQEDIPWFIELLYNASACKFVNQYMYMYRKEVANSISSRFSEKKYNDLYSILHDGVAFLERQKWEHETKDALYSFWGYELATLLAQSFYFKKKKFKCEQNKLKSFLWLFNYTYNPKVRKVNVLNRILGQYLTSFFLHLYLKKKLSNK